MITVIIELYVMILLAWAITYLNYQYIKVYSNSQCSLDLKLEKLEVDRITDIFYKYFYIFIGYFLISNFFIINYIDNMILFHSFGIGFSLFFLYIQSYVVYRWKLIICYVKLQK